MLYFHVMSMNMLILYHFQALCVLRPRLALGLAFEGHGSPSPRLTRICVYLQNLKTISAQIISKKCMQILPCKGKLYHRLKQNVLGSKSSQFDRLRLRLRLQHPWRQGFRFWADLADKFSSKSVFLFQCIHRPIQIPVI